MAMKTISFFMSLAACLTLAAPAMASGGEFELNGAALSAVWVTPFVCMLLSIALGPLVAPHFWEHHFGKISFAWALAFLIPCLMSFGVDVALYNSLHTMVLEYIPFILLLLALFTIAGGVRLTGTLVGTPRLNTIILMAGTFMASLMGTTGAAMLFIRPILRANAHRRYRVHTMVFFIFLVANCGGSLTPLGDPPLFLGFLKGVPFFWVTKYLFVKTVFICVVLLALYFLIDTFLYKKEGAPMPDLTGPQEKFGFEGKVNLILLLGVVALVLISGTWKSPVEISVGYDLTIGLPALIRDLGFIALALASLKLTKKETRQGNDFTWAPILEVAKIFAGIFITMMPAIAILRAGEAGALKSVIALVSGPDGQPVNTMYFWMTGALSSFLDNAPTYLVFFNTAAGAHGAEYMIGQIPSTLAAISAGAVFMGANTYIGNAPNFMVKAIAVEQGVKMPSFFGYMLWSGCILLPIFALMTFLFF